MVAFNYRMYDPDFDISWSSSVFDTLPALDRATVGYFKRIILNTLDMAVQITRRFAQLGDDVRYEGIWPDIDELYGNIRVLERVRSSIRQLYPELQFDHGRAGWRAIRFLRDQYYMICRDQRRYLNWAVYVASADYKT